MSQDKVYLTEIAYNNYNIITQVAGTRVYDIDEQHCKNVEKFVKESIGDLLRSDYPMDKRYNASHTKPAEWEKLGSLDRKSPDMWQVQAYNHFQPVSLAEYTQLQQTHGQRGESYTQLDGNNYQGTHLFIPSWRFIVARVYCIVHRINESSFNDTYFYDKKKQKTYDPVWFPTYQGARGTADHIYDGVEVEKYYIVM